MKFRKKREKGVWIITKLEINYSYNFIKRWNVDLENFTFIFIHNVWKITESEVWKLWEIEFNLGGNM